MARKKSARHQQEEPNIEVICQKKKLEMISSAVRNARQHGIKLEAGTPNPAAGDCAFEAAILNNNERDCFREKFHMSANYYRRIWTTDMCNRTIHSPWNTVSEAEWRDGWKKMSMPGTYEFDIFGDLVLPGIACGLNKYILIFKTDWRSFQDSVYVVDPRQFNVKPDTIIPIILAYNLVHYESMIPSTSKDLEICIKLVEGNLAEPHLPVDENVTQLTPKQDIEGFENKLVDKKTDEDQYEGSRNLCMEHERLTKRDYCTQNDKKDEESWNIHLEKERLSIRNYRQQKKDQGDINSRKVHLEQERLRLINYRKKMVAGDQESRKEHLEQEQLRISNYRQQKKDGDEESRKVHLEQERLRISNYRQQKKKRWR